jgi:hypothetical protein
MERQILYSGILLGVVMAMISFRRATITEVVRDKDGRIVQIVTMHQPMGIFGNWMYNVSTPKEIVPSYEVIETKTTEKRKRVEGIIP